MAVTFTPLEGTDEILVKFTNAYLSYPHIFERFAGKNEKGEKGKSKYSATFCFPRSDPQAKADALAIHAECMKMAKRVLKTSLPSANYCMKNGKDLKEQMHPYFVLKASEDDRPEAVDRRLKPVTAEDELFYPGCKVNGVVKLWAQNNSWGQKINANFLMIQFVEHGERWGGRARPDTKGLMSDISGNFDDDEYSGGPTGNVDGPDSSDDGFGDDDDDIAF